MRKPSRVLEVKNSLEELINLINAAARGKSARLVAAIQNLASDSPEDLGALKKFSIPPTGEEATKAVRRLEREVEALRKLDQPGILKLLDAKVEQRWMVTEYHGAGTLAQQRQRYKGDALAALKAFRPLVAAVARLHQDGIIHRDIKPENVFVACDGRLVLGDFGIVFFRDDAGARPTETFERVGSRDWMAPWANTGTRLEDVKTSFDVFPLGKLLWSMISGRAMLPYWQHRKPDHNLEVLFPAVASEMELINAVLDCCIVEDESDCLPSAEQLLPQIDDAIVVLQRGGRILREGAPRPCRICGRGTYRMLRGTRGATDRILMAADKDVLQAKSIEVVRHPENGQTLTVRMFACEVCGHLEIFHFGEGPVAPMAWRG